MFRILYQALAGLRRARPELPLEVHDQIREAMENKLLRRPYLARGPDGRVSALRIRSEVRKQLGWSVKSWIRSRLDADGNGRPGPKNAMSLDSPMEHHDGEPVGALHDRLGSDVNAPDRILESREELEELAGLAKEIGGETLEIVSGYLRGDTKAEIGRRTCLRENTVSARKSRFVKRLREHR